MDTTMNRSVDVGPTRARPGLALFLALLSIPGTTMVWDLDVPVPGLWIGGPLGVAAILLAALALGQMIIWTAVSLVG